MAIAVNCPSCQAAYRLADTLAGKTVRCQKCGDKFTVPAANAAAVTPVAPPPRPAAPALDDELSRKKRLVDDELPRKKRLVDDEDDVPRKRLDEDDDFDDVPRKKKKKVKQGSNTMLIVGGILLAVVVICGGFATVVAFMVYSTVQTVDKGIREAVAEIEKAEQFHHGMPLNVNDPAVQKIVTIKADLDPNGQFTQGGVLSNNDPRFSGKPVKQYLVNLEKDKTYQIDLMSEQMDSFLRVFGPDNRMLMQNDDGGDSLDSQIILRPQQTGVHRIHATCLFNPRQNNVNYTLTIRRQ